MPYRPQAATIGKASLVTVDTRGQRFTGRVTTRGYSSDENGQPVLDVSGSDALSLLGGLRAWPQPDADTSSWLVKQDGQTLYALPQNVAYYTDTDVAETALVRLIRANAARYGAPYVVGPSQGRGKSIHLHERNTNILEVAQAKCGFAGIGIRMGLVSDSPSATTAELTVEFYEPRDRSSRVKLSHRAGTLRSWKQSDNAPTATRAIIGGSGKGVGRWFALLPFPDSEAEWFWPMETFVDARDTDIPETQFERGMAALTEAAEQSAFELEAAEAKGMRFGEHFVVGDLVSIDLLTGVSKVDRLNSVVLTAGSDGVSISLRPGNPDGNDPMFRQSTITRGLRRAIRWLQQEES